MDTLLGECHIQPVPRVRKGKRDFEVHRNLFQAGRISRERPNPILKI